MGYHTEIRRYTSNPIGVERGSKSWGTLWLRSCDGAWLTQSCPWVGLTRRLGWVGNGSKICVFSGTGRVMGLKWHVRKIHVVYIYVTLCRVSTGKFVLRKLAVGASLHHLFEIFILCPLTVLLTLYQSRWASCCSMYGGWVVYGLGWVMGP